MTAIVCGGRAVTDELAAIGAPCAREFKPRGWGCSDADAIEQARAAGWSVAGPVPMCPRCRRTDPAITAPR